MYQYPTFTRSINAVRSSGGHSFYPMWSTDDYRCQYCGYQLNYSEIMKAQSGEWVGSRYCLWNYVIQTVNKIGNQ